jgi:hypothetical protein
MSNSAPKDPPLGQKLLSSPMGQPVFGNGIVLAIGRRRAPMINATLRSCWHLLALCGERCPARAVMRTTRTFANATGLIRSRLGMPSVLDGFELHRPDIPYSVGSISGHTLRMRALPDSRRQQL